MLSIDVRPVGPDPGESLTWSEDTAVMSLEFSCCDDLRNDLQ